MASPVIIDFKLGGFDAVERALRTVSQSAQRAATEQVRAQTRAERATTQSADRAAKAKVKADAQAVREVNSILAEDVRQWEKAEKEKTRATQRETRERERVAKQAARERERAEANINRIGAGVGRSIAGGARAGLNRATGILGAGAGLVTGAVGTAGIISAVENAVQLEKAIAQISADVSSGGKSNLDTTATRNSVQSLAQKTGISSLDIVKGLETAAGEGGGLPGLQAFQKNLENIGDLSLASGTKMEDLAKISAALTNNQITDAEEQMNIMRSLHAGAKEGNINLRDLGPGIAAVMGAIKAGGYKGSDAMQAGGLAQIAKMGGATSAEDAVTAARNLFNDLATHEKNLRTLGVNTMDKTGQHRTNVIDQFIQLMDKTGGNMQKINFKGQMFGMQSQPLVGALMAAYRGENKDLGGLSGGAAVRALIDKFGGAGMSQADVKTDADRLRGTAAVQFEMQMERFKAVVGNELLPKLVEAAPAFAKLTDAVIWLTKEFASAPEMTIAAFIGVNVALGAFQSSLTAAATTGNASVASLGKMNAALVAVSVGLAAFAAMSVFVKAQDEADEKKLKKEKEQEAKSIEYYRNRKASGESTITEDYILEKMEAEVSRKSQRGFWQRTKDEYYNAQGTDEQILKNGSGTEMAGAAVRMAIYNPFRALVRAAGNESDKADYANVLNTPTSKKAFKYEGPTLTGEGGAAAQLGAEISKTLGAKLDGELKVRIMNPEAMGPPAPPGSPIPPS